jgi:tRNA G18 (ribose-2'-O)-methylase SpoU
LYAVSRETIRSVAGFNFHRGFLASASRLPFASITSFRRDRLSLGLVDVGDTQNLGSMLRSAAAFGVRQVLLDRRTADPYCRRSVRVSMGASLAMDYRLMDEPAEALRDLAAVGVRTLAATLAADAVPVERLAIDERPLVLLLGNEGNGLPLAVQRAATDRVIIPMGGKPAAGGMVDSLNVSVAAAILMFQLSRRWG